jgi:two-component system OmpR family response regulator
VTTGVTSAANRVLVVDDEPYITDVVTSALAFEGFETDEASSGSQALEKARIGGYDFIVLDVMLPDVDGFEVARRLREEDIHTPVVFLTARDTGSDKLAGLAIGDDYVTKPFSIDELVARIRAVLRRSALDELSAGDRLQFRDLVIDLDGHRVWRAGQSIELTATEFRLLHYLASHPRQVLSKDQILDVVWDDTFVGESNIVEIYISYLRKKIDCFDPPLIQTVRGIGYCLREPTR